MVKRILPAECDNHYHGHKSALWVFAVISIMKLAVSVVHMFYADGGAQSIATIPLNTYSAGAAQNLIALYARLGLEQLSLCVLFLLVLLRYRAMIPLMYVLVVAGHIAQRGVAYMKPTVVAGTSGAGPPALVLTALSIVGLVLSLRGRGYRAAHTVPSA